MYSYDKYLRTLSPNDTNIQIVDNNGVVKFTIEPYSVLNTMVNNNLLKINLINKVITITFSSNNEAKLALPFFQEYLDELKSRDPLLVDNKLEKVIQNKISESYLNINSHLIPGTGSTYDLGSTEGYNWRDLYLSGDTIYLGDSVIKSEQNNIIIENLILGGPTSQGGILLSTSGDSLLINGNEIESGKATQSNVLPYIELTNQAFLFNPFIGEPVLFTKTDYGDEVDEIDTNIAITRGDNQGIYNPYLELEWDNTDDDGNSPLNTLWNKDGWDDLTNVSERRYYTFYQIFNGNIGNNVRNTELIMKDVSNNKYYKFYFTVWGQSWIGAPVTYTRQQIDEITGENIGDEVEFIKLGGEDPTLVNDPIDTDLTIARGNNQGIYNIALEDGWSRDGDGENSPEGTLWNSGGWGNLRNIPNRSFTTFYEALSFRIGNNIIGEELIMYDTINNKYYAFKFNSWTRNNNGGGFSYSRQLLNTSDLFIKQDYGNEIDIISNDLHITRGNLGWLYNPLLDDGHDDETPTNSLWNNDGWDNLNNIEERTYKSISDIWEGNFENIPGSEMIMLDTSTNKYWAIKFLSWTPGQNGGGFSYLRYEIDLNQLNEGLIFSDGTILKSAGGLGKIKSKSPGGRRIEEITGYIEVDITEAITENNVEATVYQNNNGNFDFYVVDTSEFIELYNNRDSWTKLEFSFDEGDTWREVELSGGSTGVWRQIYFPNSQSEDYVTVTTGQSLLYRVTRGGNPVRWFRADGQNVRGATIDYHAYSRESGTIIGTIHISRDNGNNTISHTESKSGSSNINQLDIWYRNGDEREIWFRRLDGRKDTLKVQWIAKIFYGNEYYD
jgi:hypothetical protein